MIILLAILELFSLPPVAPELAASSPPLTVPQEEAEEAEEEEPPLLEWWLSSLSIDVKTLEGDASELGIDVEWQKELGTILGSSEEIGLGGDVDFGLLAALEVEGRFGTASAEDDNTPRVLIVRPSVYTTARFGDVDGFDQVLDLGFAPAKIEADQDFDTVTVGFETYLQTPVPYSPRLAAGLHRLFGAPDRPRTLPIWLRAGWTMVDEVEDDPDLDPRDRFEARLTWRVDLREDFRLTVDARHTWEEGDEDYGFVETELALPVAKRTTLELSYTDGRLPLSPEAAHSFSLGVSIEF